MELFWQYRDYLRVCYYSYITNYYRVDCYVVARNNDDDR